MQLRYPGREDSVLDGVSPPQRGLASAFGKTRSLRQITPKVLSPACSPSCVGFPRFTRLSHGTRRWALTFTIPGVGQSPLRTSLSLRQTGASVARPIPIWPLAQRRSLGEQQGKKPTGSPESYISVRNLSKIPCYTLLPLLAHCYIEIPSQHLKLHHHGKV